MSYNKISLLIIVSFAWQPTFCMQISIAGTSAQALAATQLPEPLTIEKAAYAFSEYPDCASKIVEIFTDMFMRDLQGVFPSTEESKIFNQMKMEMLRKITDRVAYRAIPAVFAKIDQNKIINTAVFEDLRKKYLSLGGSLSYLDALLNKTYLDLPELDETVLENEYAVAKAAGVRILTPEENLKLAEGIFPSNIEEFGPLVDALLQVILNIHRKDPLALDVHLFNPLNPQNFEEKYHYNAHMMYERMLNYEARFARKAQEQKNLAEKMPTSWHSEQLRSVTPAPAAQPLIPLLREQEVKPIIKREKVTVTQ